MSDWRFFCGFPPKTTVHQGKLVFAQRMLYLPLSTFHRCVAEHNGEHRVKDFSCLDQFFAMAFAQLTYRESLRDIAVNLRAQARRLHHTGFRCQTISRNRLANANATRPWQIYADFAQHLIGLARPLYAHLLIINQWQRDIGVMQVIEDSLLVGCDAFRQPNFHHQPIKRRVHASGLKAIGELLAMEFLDLDHRKNEAPMLLSMLLSTSLLSFALRLIQLE